MLLGARYTTVFSLISEFRYLRLRITSTSCADGSVQLSYIGFAKDSYEFVRDGQFKVSVTATDPQFFSWPSGTTVSATSTGSSTEQPINILQRSTTKHCASFSSPHDIVIDLGYGNRIDVSQYKYWGWYSANDVPCRDPEEYTLSGSNNGSSWTMLDNAAASGNSTWLQSTERNVLQYVGKVGGDSLRGALTPDGYLVISDQARNTDYFEYGFIPVDGQLDSDSMLPVLV